MLPIAEIAIRIAVATAAVSETPTAEFSVVTLKYCEYVGSFIWKILGMAYSCGVIFEWTVFPVECDTLWVKLARPTVTVRLGRLPYK